MAAKRNNNLWPYKSIRGKKGNEGRDTLVVSSVEAKEHSLFLSERETRLVIKRLEPLLQTFPSVSKRFQAFPSVSKRRQRQTKHRFKHAYSHCDLPFGVIRSLSPCFRSKFSGSSYEILAAKTERSFYVSLLLGFLRFPNRTIVLRFSKCIYSTMTQDDYRS